MDNFEYRKIERTGFCRGCDKQLSIGTMIFYTYSIRNRGQSIVFCEECIDELVEFRKENKNG